MMTKKNWYKDYADFLDKPNNVSKGIFKAFINGYIWLKMDKRSSLLIRREEEVK